jgi:hypothetical protein
LPRTDVGWHQAKSRDLDCEIEKIERTVRKVTFVAVAMVDGVRLRLPKHSKLPE